jgi:hypothetical protein
MANPSTKRRRLTDVYAFAGFRALATVRGMFGNPQIRVITLVRRSKKRSAAAAVVCTGAGTTGGYGACAISPVAFGTSFWTSRFGAWLAGVAAR